FSSFAPCLEKHLGARFRQQPCLVVPVVHLEALVDQPIVRRPDLAAPVVLLGIERVIAADRRQNPLPREFARVVKELPERAGLLAPRHLPQERKEYVWPYLGKEAFAFVAVPAAIVIALARR